MVGKDKVRIGLGHVVQRGNLDYPVKGLIHNGAVRSFFFFFCARRACFVRKKSAVSTSKIKSRYGNSNPPTAHWAECQGAKLLILNPLKPLSV